MNHQPPTATEAMEATHNVETYRFRDFVAVNLPGQTVYLEPATARQLASHLQNVAADIAGGVVFSESEIPTQTTTLEGPFIVAADASYGGTVYFAGDRMGDLTCEPGYAREFDTMQAADNARLSLLLKYERHGGPDSPSNFRIEVLPA